MPLSGLRIVDLSEGVAAQACVRHLEQMGARIIRMSPTERGVERIRRLADQVDVALHSSLTGSCGCEELRRFNAGLVCLAIPQGIGLASEDGPCRSADELEHQSLVCALVLLAGLVQRLAAQNEALRPFGRNGDDCGSLQTLDQGPGDRRIPLRSAAGIVEHLTVKEAAVLRLLADGLSNREIAQRRGVTPNTVRSHVRNIYSKLQSSSRVQVAVMASNWMTSSRPGIPA